MFLGQITLFLGSDKDGHRQNVEWISFRFSYGALCSLAGSP